jgi:hypothetical protein
MTAEYEPPKSRRGFFTAIILSIAINTAAAVGALVFLPSFWCVDGMALMAINGIVFAIIRQTRASLASDVLMGALVGLPLGGIGTFAFIIWSCFQPGVAAAAHQGCF